MTYRTFDFSSDVGIEAEADSPGGALVELGRAMAKVLTDGSEIRPSTAKAVEVRGARDWPGTAVAWINELVFLFDTEQFLVAGGEVEVTTQDGIQLVSGTLKGEPFDARRHQAGRGVKAATFHDAEYAAQGKVHRFRLVLDL